MCSFLAFERFIWVCCTSLHHQDAVFTDIALDSHLALQEAYLQSLVVGILLQISKLKSRCCQCRHLYLGQEMNSNTQMEMSSAPVICLRVSHLVSNYHIKRIGFPTRLLIHLLEDFFALDDQSLYHQVPKLNVNGDPAARLSARSGEQDNWEKAGTQGRDELNCSLDLTDCTDQLSTK